MVFSSTLFLCMFLPITLLGYYLIRDDHKNTWLLLASLLFFAWPQPGYLWIILLNIGINYVSAIIIDHLSRFRKSINCKVPLQEKRIEK